MLDHSWKVVDKDQEQERPQDGFLWKTSGNLSPLGTGTVGQNMLSPSR